jgi:hypothetical protein
MLSIESWKFLALRSSSFHLLVANVITRSGQRKQNPSNAAVHTDVLLYVKAPPSVARTVHDTLLSPNCKVLHQHAHTLAVYSVRSTILSRTKRTVDSSTISYLEKNSSAGLLMGCRPRRSWGQFRPNSTHTCAQNCTWIVVLRKTNLMHNLFLVYFINLYMFRAYLGPSSGGTTVFIHSCYLFFFLHECLLFWFDWNYPIQPAQQKNKYQLLYTYSCTSWWWV